MEQETAGGGPMLGFTGAQIPQMRREDAVGQLNRVDLEGGFVRIVRAPGIKLGKS